MFMKYIYTETDDKIFEFEYSFMKTAVNNYVPINLRSNIKS